MLYPTELRAHRWLGEGKVVPADGCHIAGSGEDGQAGGRILRSGGVLVFNALHGRRGRDEGGRKKSGCRGDRLTQRTPQQPGGGVAGAACSSPQSIGGRDARTSACRRRFVGGGVGRDLHPRRRPDPRRGRGGRRRKCQSVRGILSPLSFAFGGRGRCRRSVGGSGCRLLRPVAAALRDGRLVGGRPGGFHSSPARRILDFFPGPTFRFLTPHSPFLRSRQ